MTIKEANMGVNWSKDIDQSLAAAKEQSRPILLDFGWYLEPSYEYKFGPGHEH